MGRKRREGRNAFGSWKTKGWAVNWIEYSLDKANLRELRGTVNPYIVHCWFTAVRRSVLVRTLEGRREQTGGGGKSQSKSWLKFTAARTWCGMAAMERNTWGEMRGIQSQHQHWASMRLAWPLGNTISQNNKVAEAAWTLNSHPGRSLVVEPLKMLKQAF